MCLVMSAVIVSVQETTVQARDLASTGTRHVYVCRLFVDLSYYWEQEDLRHEQFNRGPQHTICW